MPDFAPFRGVRFAADSASPAARISPPYDVIDAQHHQRLLDHDAHNAVRWILGLDPANPYAGADEYRRRGEEFLSWLQSGVLVEDDEPMLYLYSLSFRDHGGKQRQYRGLFGAVAAEPWASGGVLPHEEVRPKVVDDRLALMRATRANMGVVQLVIDGRDGAFGGILDGAQRELLFEGSDEAGDQHRLEAIRGDAAARALGDVLAGASSVVADGHHRYTTAVRLREEDGIDGSDKALAVVADLFQDGIEIYETHRLLLWEGSGGEAATTLAQVKSALDDGSGDRWRLEAGTGESCELMSSADLDRPTLARRLVDALEGVPEPTIETFHDEAAARARLDEWQGEALACWMPPVSKEEFWARASRGEVFPPKTTYFLPKVCTGIVARRLGD
ncbi:MAG: DUF1015 domain-containing protein [Planctomycetota bacterium]